jgi:hypothetical protein
MDFLMDLADAAMLEQKRVRCQSGGGSRVKKGFVRQLSSLIQSVSHLSHLDLTYLSISSPFPIIFS